MQNISRMDSTLDWISQINLKELEIIGENVNVAN